MEILKQRLKKLRLKAFADNLENRISHAQTAKLTYGDFLSFLVEDQEVLKSKKDYAKRLKKSNLNLAKTLENYTFANQPSVNKEHIYSLASCDFIRQKAKLVILGISGVGKSHLTCGIGLKSIEKGFKAVQYNSNDLVDLLLSLKKNEGYEKFLKEILSMDLVIIDEMCLLEYPPGGSNLLMRLLEKLDENIAVAFTSNRELSDWVPFFSDEVVASAFVDRTINHATIIRIVGNSNRAAQHQIS